MQMSNTLFESLKSAVGSILMKYPNADKYYKTKGLPHKTYRKALLSTLAGEGLFSMSDCTDEGLSEDDIDEAMQNIVPSFTKS